MKKMFFVLKKKAFELVAMNFPELTKSDVFKLYVCQNYEKIG